MNTTADRIDLAAFARVPADLTTPNQWVLWRKEAREPGGKLTKVPVNVRTGRLASSTDPATWASYGEALDAYAAAPGEFDGIGFVFSPSDPFVGVDFDNALDDAASLLPWAAELFAPLAGTYAEISPYGRGVKVFACGRLPGDGTGANRKGFGPDGTGGVEVYQAGRYFAVTGRRFGDCPAAVNDAAEAVARLYEQVRPKPKPRPSAPKGPAARGAGDRVKRCVAYLEKCPDAVSGQGGHNATLRAASECYRFGLSDAEAWDVLLWFNETKTAGELWTEKELRHKLDSARAKVGGDFGSRLAEDRPGWKPLNGNGRTTAAGAESRDEAGAEGAAGGADASGRPAGWSLADLSRQMTDTGNAARFAVRHGEHFRYCHQRGSWLRWTGKRWEWDVTGRAVAAAKDTAMSVFAEAQAEAKLGTDAQARGDETAAGEHFARSGALSKWAVTSQRRDRIVAMLALAQPDLAVTVAELDADPMLLNCRNGTIDLRTGELRPHRREDFCTNLAAADYRPGADAPTFRRFLARIFRTHPALVRYVQTAIGYAATGQTREQALFFLYGRGANGKTTLMDAVMGVLAGYASKADPDLLMARDGSGAHPCGVADLMGRRLVVCSETNEGKRFDESKLKDLVGETRLKARFMRQDFFEFGATHKVVMYSNHKPIVRGTDHGFWRRMRLIPFIETIDDEEKDKNLPAKLAAEADGIVAWIVEGAVRWNREGLKTSPEVEAATREYRDEMDTVGAFLAECCDEGPDLVSYAGKLYAAYTGWAEKSGEHAVSQKRLGGALAERGFQSERCSYSGLKKWRGVALKEPKTPES